MSFGSDQHILLESENPNMSGDTPTEQAIAELEAGLDATSLEAKDERIENAITILEDVLF